MVVTVELVEPERAYRLRQEVLRPYLSIAEIAADDRPAPTFAVVSPPGGELICCATLLHEAAPEVVPPAARLERDGYRLRNMATAPGHRGEGLGRAVLGAVMNHIADAGGGVLWCHARAGAIGFYEHLGLEQAGPLFEVERIGPHVVMWSVIRSATG